MHLQQQFHSSGRRAGNRSKDCFLLAKCLLLLLLLCYHTGKDPTSLSSALQPAGAFREKTKYINNSKLGSEPWKRTLSCIWLSLCTRRCTHQWLLLWQLIFTSGKFTLCYISANVLKWQARGFGCQTQPFHHCGHSKQSPVMLDQKLLALQQQCELTKQKTNSSHLRIISVLTLAVKVQRAFEACSYFSLPLRNSWGLWQPGVSCNGRFSDSVRLEQEPLIIPLKCRYRYG